MTDLEGVAAPRPGLPWPTLFLLALWTWAIWACAEHWRGNPNYSYGWAVPVLALAFGMRRYLLLRQDSGVVGAAPSGAMVVGLALASAVVYTLVRSAGSLRHLGFFTSDMSGVRPTDPLTRGGVLHAMVGSIIEIAIAVTITVPLGIGTAVFMSEVGGRLAKVVRTVVEAMTALPSIVAGLFIYTVLIISLGFNRSGFAAAMAISVMILPIIARGSYIALRIVPNGLREASLALGSSQWQTVWRVVLPTARPGLTTAVILGIARGVGETSPVLLTSGASTFLGLNPLVGAMNSLPLYVFSAVRSGQTLYIARGFGAASVLLLLVLVLFVIMRRLARQQASR